MPKGSATTSVDVEIYGTSYKLRGENPPEHFHELAGFVDEKMREIATRTATVDTTKIAILAALNIAEELQACRSHGTGEDQRKVSDKVAQLAGQLESALEEAP